MKENQTFLDWAFNSFPVCEAQGVPLGMVPDNVVSSVLKAALNTSGYFID